MGALNRSNYETLETDRDEKVTFRSETSAGALKHNGSLAVDVGKLQDEQAAISPRAIGTAATMANNTLFQTDADSQSATLLGDDDGLLAALTGKALEEQPIWVGLWESIQDVFFPKKLPPLVLTSTPIPVPDRMAVKANPVAIGISSTLNIAVLLLFIWLGIRAIRNYVNPPV